MTVKYNQQHLIGLRIYFIREHRQKKDVTNSYKNLLFTFRLLYAYLLLLSQHFDRSIFWLSSGVCLFEYSSGNFELNHLL